MFPISCLSLPKMFVKIQKNLKVIKNQDFDNITIKTKNFLSLVLSDLN